MVEWKKLGEIAEITIGEFVHRDKQNPKAPYPVYNGGTTYTGFYDNYNNEGNKIVISARGYAGFVNRVFDKYWAGNSSYSINVNSPQIIWHYVYYYLKNEQYNIMSMQQKGGGLAAISKKQVQEILIPIPSLQEQERIIGILDTFTDSIENLKQQIAQRRKQYEHYRDQLLDLEGKEGVEIKTLGEIVSSGCSLSYGIVQPGDDVSKGVPIVRPVDLVGLYVHRYGLKRTTKAISDSYKRTILEGDEILFCVRGTTGIMSLATKELKGCNVTRGIVPISFNNDITKMFVYYVLKTNRLQMKISEKTNGTALKQINIKDLRILSLPIPSIEEQQRIVSILDTFEASISNLEAQLEQRQKQYEYYRNKLLSFEKEEH